ncbi:hypothetical protein GF366_01190 [Candidatus Peregrinibacteria bacterium]|nr:hypothetical protein [Candidatus Peregrinibacteria bacterium]
MDQALKEYIEYYRARMKRYENNPMYINSYETEKALFEAISSCETLKEFKEKVGDLPLKNAIAFVKDKNKALKELYDKLNEPVRGGSTKEILETIDEAEINSDMDLVNFLADIEQKHSRLILKDELGITEFIGDIDMLENIETWENADVTDEFEEEVNEKSPKEARKEGQKDWEERVLPKIRDWFPDWEIDYDAILNEERHRRKLPYPDDVVKKRIEQHKLYRGTK